MMAFLQVWSRHGVSVERSPGDADSVHLRAQGRAAQEYIKPATSHLPETVQAFKDIPGVKMRPAFGHARMQASAAMPSMRLKLAQLSYEPCSLGGRRCVLSGVMAALN